MPALEPAPPTSPSAVVPKGPPDDLLRVRLQASLTSHEVGLLADLATACTRVDGRAPLSEQTLLHARYGEPAEPARPDEPAGQGRPRWVLAWVGAGREARLVGAAHWDDAGEGGPDGERGVSAEWLVAPDARLLAVPRSDGPGLTSGEHVAGGVVTDRLLSGLRQAAPQGVPLDLWVHGERSWAAEVLRARAGGGGDPGLRLVRTLWQMRRPLAHPDPDLEAVSVPRPGEVIPVAGRPHPADSVTGDAAARTGQRRRDGLHLRTFEVGRDEAAWLEVNARAFASHPEQGRWSAADLAAREREPWFDPAGFFVAERVAGGSATARLVGFHWTKVHRPPPPAPGSPVPGADPDDGGATPGDGGATPGDGGATPGDGGASLGEIYVLGVDPSEQGSGLGRVLAQVGLAYLQRRGLHTAMLYVEADNGPAVRLYATLGFTHVDTDRMYRLA